MHVKVQQFYGFHQLSSVVQLMLLLVIYFLSWFKTVLMHRGLMFSSLNHLVHLLKGLFSGVMDQFIAFSLQVDVVFKERN